MSKVARKPSLEEKTKPAKGRAYLCRKQTASKKLGDLITLLLSLNIHSVGNILAGSMSVITLIG